MMFTGYLLKWLKHLAQTSCHVVFAANTDQKHALNARRKYLDIDAKHDMAYVKIVCNFQPETFCGSPVCPSPNPTIWDKHQW